MQQRLGLAAALLGDPALVILDEPTSALDPVGRDDVRAIIRDARERGSAVLLNSHLLGEVERLCDHVAIVNRGRVVAAGSLADLLGEQAVRLRVTDLPADGRAAARRLRPGHDGRRGLAGDPARGPGADPRPRAPRSWRPGAGCTRWIRPVARWRTCSWALSGTATGRRRAERGARRMSPRLVLVIAGLTLREIARRRILWVLLGLSRRERRCSSAGAWTASSTLARAEGVKELEVRIGVSQVLILIAFMFSFVLAMSAAFLAAPAIASDVETGTVHAMLARPLRRAELVVGRWLGLSIVVAGYAVLSGLLAIAAVALVSGHMPPAPGVAVAFLAFQAVAVLTLALALGHPAAGDRRRGDHRRPVRPRLVRRGPGQHRRRVRRGAARRRSATRSGS